MNYDEFLRSKRIIYHSAGIEASPDDIHELLFPFQRDLTAWAARKGRAAIFADTGLGKTLMQLEWARLIGERTLIIAPLSVARQTVREAVKVGLDVHYVRSDEAADATVEARIFITNYEMIGKFSPGKFGAVVLDESSILKAMAGKTRRKLTDMFADTLYKLCCTATPAPNDITEIANHAEFLGIMTRTNMLAAFFVHDDKGWRLRGHAEEAFYRWLASWGMSVKKPSDLGYDDDGFILPPLNVKPVFVKTDYCPEGQLFFTGLKGIQHRSRVRRATLGARVSRAIEIVNSEDLWYNLGYEYTNKEGKTESIHAEVVQGTSGALPCLQRKDEGQAQCAAAGAICPGQGAPEQDMRGSKKVVTGKPDKKKGAETKKGTRNLLNRVSSNTRESEGEMRNLRLCKHGQSDALPGSRSLPQDERSSGATLHKLQSRSGKIQGRSSSISGSHCVSEKEQWIVWCGLNAEQDAMAAALGDDCVSVYGSLALDEKISRIEAWQAGEARVLISKPSVCGFGMNFQNAHKMVFVGLSDSWEAYYQCTRRCWRFMQEKPVDVYVILSDVEDAIWQNVQRKNEEAERMSKRLIEHVSEFEQAELDGDGMNGYTYEADTVTEKDFTLMLGDSVERMAEIPDDSVDLSMFSPPFMDLYTYSPSERDLGNSHTPEEFFEHFGYIIDHLLRVTRPGRICAVHTADVPALLSKDGYIGLKDFPGKVIAAFESRGWIYHGRVTIDKNPQAQAIRTHAKALLFAQLDKDSSWSRPAIGDYILAFRKPGENAVPITPVKGGELTRDLWIEWAHPVWYGIRESDTLQYTTARGANDDKHICPLQLGTIERCVKLWSNPGETVFSPFAGIGSEIYQAVKFGRRGIGIELKPGYFRVAVRNLRDAVRIKNQPDLFSIAGIEME